MAVKKSYNRYFIIFQEEDKGYGIAIDKQPTGYTKIENRSGKCKITVYAQNLVKEKGPYYGYLVDSTKDPLVMAKLGAINIDDTGRGETWWEFKEDDIADTGVPFDRFNIAAVITGENKINAPLAGYIGKDKVSWKDRVPFVANAANETIEKENVNEEEPVAKEEPEELDEEAKKFKEYEEDIKADAANDGERWKKDKDKKENVKGESKSKDDNKEEAKSKGNENKKENLKSESEKAESKKDDPKDPDGKDKDNKKDDPRKEGAKAESKEGAKAESKKDDPKDPDGKDKDNKKDDPRKEGAKAESKEGTKAESKEAVKPESKDGAKDDPKNAPKEGAKDNPKEEAAEKPGKLPGVIEPFNYDEDIEAKEVSGYLDDSFNKNYDRKGDKDKRPFATMFHDILEDFDEEDELTDEFTNTRWWKIPLSDDIPISENLYYPYYCAIYHLKMTYPYINYIKHFKDTGHYHFGMKYDNAGEVKYIIYGIEGNNSSNFQPYMGMTGFIRWIKMKNRDKGLWIMYYNPHTGNIMIPKKR